MTELGIGFGAHLCYCFICTKHMLLLSSSSWGWKFDLVSLGQASEDLTGRLPVGGESRRVLIRYDIQSYTLSSQCCHSLPRDLAYAMNDTESRVKVEDNHKRRR